MGSLKAPISQAKKLQCRCPECNWPGASHKPHRSFNQIPGLVTADTVLKCGKCGHASSIVHEDGTAWIDRDTANRLAAAGAPKFAEWVEKNLPTVKA